MPIQTGQASLSAQIYVATHRSQRFDVERSLEFCQMLFHLPQLGCVPSVRRKTATWRRRRVADWQLCPEVNRKTSPAQLLADAGTRNDTAQALQRACDPVREKSCPHAHDLPAAATHNCLSRALSGHAR